MRLVPRQLQRAGMTGTVPYYGGRLTPAQARAAAHPAARTAAPAPRSTPQERLAALQELLDAGVVDQDEYDDLRSRIVP